MTHYALPATEQAVKENRIRLAETPRSFQVRTPLPFTSRLSKNARLHWSKSKTHADQYKIETATGARNAAGHGSIPRFGGAALDILFILPSFRVDWDNVITAIKPGIDALKHCSIVADDTVADLYPFTVDRRLARTGEEPAVVYTFTERTP